jgi:hypothetical protein
MFERMIDLQSRVHQFYDEEKWRYIWLLLAAGGCYSSLCLSCA